MSLSKANEAFEIFKNGYNKQVIFYGPPGTSKTYTSTILAAKTLAMHDAFAPKLDTYEAAQEYLDGHQDCYKIVQFHPSYTYEDFIRGITMDMVKDANGNNQINYKVVDKVFGEIAVLAENDPNNAYVLIIDEINRAPLASVLGELIYGLEYRGDAFSTPYSKDDGSGHKDNTLKVPDNLYIIGTMNTADRSIGSMDYAVRRRFAFVSLPSEVEVVKASWDAFAKATPEAKVFVDSIEKLYQLVMECFVADTIADPSIDPEDIKLGHTYFLYSKEKCLDENNVVTIEKAKSYMEYRLNYQIKPILLEYIKDGLLKDTLKERIKTLSI
ncbi:McrB family protein [Chakrabartyella piscis]|uniref:McrB family protein n=1 Tax=Chakrabartyella piscis TaxID=2918914 RepID=UPI00295895D6|nr:AAA family ATPase [Chakrabartyella piscis]